MYYCNNDYFTYSFIAVNNKNVLLTFLRKKFLLLLDTVAQTVINKWFTLFLNKADVVQCYKFFCLGYLEIIFPNSARDAIIANKSRISAALDYLNMSVHTRLHVK